MLPLGDWWTGECHAAAGPVRHSGVAGCETGCNLGYAREQCAWFPAGEGPDAVRFAISSHENELVRIQYVIESDHHPFANGKVEYALADRGLVSPPEGATLRRQMLAYVESYLRRKES